MPPTHEVTNQVPPLVDFDAAAHPALLAGLHREGAAWAEPELTALGRLAGSAQALEWGRLAEVNHPIRHPAGLAQFAKHPGVMLRRAPVDLVLERAAPALAEAASEQDRPGGNQRDAEPARRGRTLAQEYEGEQRHQHHAQLVDRGHQRRRPELERAKIAKP